MIGFSIELPLRGTSTDRSIKLSTILLRKNCLRILEVTFSTSLASIIAPFNRAEGPIGPDYELRISAKDMKWDSPLLSSPKSSHPTKSWQERRLTQYQTTAMPAYSNNWDRLKMNEIA
jgi:hypothetical protein